MIPKRSENGYQDFVNRRLDRLERSIAQTDLMVRRLVRYGVSLRSDVRRLDEGDDPTCEGPGPHRG